MDPRQDQDVEWDLYHLCGGSDVKQQQPKETRFVQLVAPWLIENMRVMLVGCGATNSYAGLALAKMGFRYFELWDPDRVERVNVGVQAYDEGDLGKRKTAALRERLERLGTVESPIVVKEIPRKFTKKSELGLRTDVVVCGPDNVAARAAVFNKLRFLGRGAKRRFYIDARVGPHNIEMWSTGFGGDGQVFNKKMYKKSLHKDVAPQGCGAESTPYVGFMVGGMVAKQVRDWATRREFYEWVALDLRTYHPLRRGKHGDGTRD
jgi:hypothetical protein